MAARTVHAAPIGFLKTASWRPFRASEDGRLPHSPRRHPRAQGEQTRRGPVSRASNTVHNASVFSFALCPTSELFSRRGTVPWVRQLETALYLSLKSGADC